MDVNLFSAGLIYLAAAAIASPIGRRLGLGAVLGYLIMGALIGPSALGLVGGNREEVLHFSEFGVVLMLFLIGLELDISKLWRMRGPIFGLGGLQVAGSAVIIALVAALFGVQWRESLALGLILALSSTAIVMQTLREHRLQETSAGQQSFAVLLFQDIAVIPILALLPLLEYGNRHASAPANGHGGTGGWIESLPVWGQGFAIVGALALVIFTGRFVLTPWLRWVAKLKAFEALTATALVLVVGVALLMNSVGLSPALGTFVAGVMLASSEFRHELEGDIEPFKGLLLAVFFLAVGAGIDFELIANRPVLITAIVAGLVAIKFAILYLLARFFGMSFDQRLLFAAALAQGGEFAFVLGSFAAGRGILSEEISALMIASVALSMALAPLLLLAMKHWVVPKIGTTEKLRNQTAREPDVKADGNKVLLAGFGRFGHPIARILRSHGCMPTVLELDSDHVDFVRKLGLQVYYGDATRIELLRAAGAAEARVLIIAVDDEDQCLKIITQCRKHFPELKILARACSRDHAFRLHESGVQYFIEQLGSSMDCAVAALVETGREEQSAKRAAAEFRNHELASIARLAPLRGDETSYIQAVRRNIEDLDSLLENSPSSD